MHWSHLNLPSNPKLIPCLWSCQVWWGGGVSVKVWLESVFTLYLDVIARLQCQAQPRVSFPVRICWAAGGGAAPSLQPAPLTTTSSSQWKSSSSRWCHHHRAEEPGGGEWKWSLWWSEWSWGARSSCHSYIIHVSILLLLHDFIIQMTLLVVVKTITILCICNSCLC